MGLFREEPTQESLQEQEAYERTKARLMRLHELAENLFYIDEVQWQEEKPLLVGDIAKGDLREGQTYRVYDYEGIPLGLMKVASFEVKEEKRFLLGTTVEYQVVPEKSWKGYVGGQFLADANLPSLEEDADA